MFAQLLTIPVSNPYLPAAARAQFCANNDFDFNTPGVQTLTPAQCTAAANAASPTDPNFRAFTTTVGRRFTEAGPRLSDFTTQFFDYRAGLKLSVTEAISLDVSGSYGESQNQQTADWVYPRLAIADGGVCDEHDELQSGCGTNRAESQSAAAAARQCRRRHDRVRARQHLRRGGLGRTRTKYLI